MEKKIALKPKQGISSIHRTKTKFIEADILRVLNLYHVDKRSMEEIAKTMKCTRQYIAKILKTNEGKLSQAGPKMLVYDPTEVMSRFSLNPFERAKKLSNDAMQVCELSVDLIKYELQATIDEVKKGGDFATLGVNIDKLTKFIQVAAPYVLERKDGKRVEESTPDQKLNKFMTMTAKQQIIKPN